MKRLCVSIVLVLAALTPVGAEMRLTHSEAMQKAVDAPLPQYNPVAKQLKVTGPVSVEATISEKGSVEEVKVVSGNAMLTGNVVSTVKKWKFKPMEAQGAPTKAVATLNFNFN